MPRRPYYDMIRGPFPEGWVPKCGDRVIVPSVRPRLYGGRPPAYSARIEKVLGDIVEVYTFQFKARQQFMLRDIRPDGAADT